MFNVDLRSLIGERYYTQVKLGNIKLDGKQTFINPEWKAGHITIGEVSEASVGYTLMYLHKPWKPMHRNDDRQPQFSLMSKGLGKNYLSAKMVNWHKNDIENRLYCNIEDGKKISMPRYYKQKLFKEIYKTDELAELHRKRVGAIQLKSLIDKQLKYMERNIQTEGQFLDYCRLLDQRKHASFAKAKIKQLQISKQF